MTDFDRKEMGVRIGQKRIAKGLTQDQVAEYIDVGRSTYNTIEAGKRPLKDKELTALAELFDTTTDYLLRGADTENVDICKATGLSNEAVSFFTQEKDHDLLGLYLSIVDSLDCLLSTEQGNKVLSALGDYLRCDFSIAYTDDSNGSSFVPLRSGIGFKYANKSYAGSEIYQFYNPVLFERSAELQLINEIATLKAEMQQEKPPQKKRIRKEK